MTEPGRTPERELIPYEASRFSARSVLVLAPHPDDEVFGCGGALAGLRAEGADVHVLLLSDGAGEEPDPGRRNAIEAARKAESAEALARLGGGSIETAGFPDRGLDGHVDEIARFILGRVAQWKPDLVFAPSPVEIHPDHRAVAVALHAAFRARGGSGADALRSATIAFFEISQPIRPNFLFDISAYQGAKERAVAAFVSQNGGHDYPAFVRGLNAYRRMTLPRQVEAAEAYYVLPGSLLAASRLDTIAAAMGPSRPVPGRQTNCIKRVEEAVMRLRNLFSVLFLGLSLTVALTPMAEGASRGGSRGGGHARPSGGHVGSSGGHGRSSAGHWRGGRGRWRGGYGHGGWGWGYPWWWGTDVVVYDGVDGDPSPERFGVVDAEVTPDSAEVYLDGKYIGTADDFDGAPDYLYVLPGKYHLELRHPLYETVKVDLAIHRGERVRLDREMKLLPGKGKLDAFDPADRGMPLGRVLGPGATPVDPRGGNRESPTWRSKDSDYGVDAEIDDSKGGASASPKASVERPAVPKRPVRPRLVWKISPDDASVYLDDRFLGDAEDLNERTTRLEAGKHTIAVTRPGYKTKTIEVETKGSEPTSVVIELEK